MHADTWSALGTCVAAGAAMVIIFIAGAAAWFARGQVLEARQTRERTAQSNVVVYVDRHEVRRYMDLVIKNFGRTTAYNVRLKLPPLQVAPYRNLHTGEVLADGANHLSVRVASVCGLLAGESVSNMYKTR